MLPVTGLEEPPAAFAEDLVYQQPLSRILSDQEGGNRHFASIVHTLTPPVEAHAAEYRTWKEGAKYGFALTSAYRESGYRRKAKTTRRAASSKLGHGVGWLLYA